MVNAVTVTIGMRMSLHRVIRSDSTDSTKPAP
jgi:hypothetical protein